MKNLRSLAILGNCIFILWIVWNGIDEGSRNVGRLEVLSLCSLVVLLALNIFLLARWKK